jgi:hypothetical protein
MIHSIAIGAQAIFFIVIRVSRDARNSPDDFKVLGFNRSVDLLLVVETVLQRHSERKDWENGRRVSGRWWRKLMEKIEIDEGIQH